MESGEEQRQRRHHFVLVHGLCHGAWCWYKVATLLSSAGHRVTALDMAGCGARPERAEEVASLEEYSRPLLDAVAALPPGEKAVLVGHSFGGLSLALAMERHPDKVAVAVFASAAMPAAGKPMTLIFQQALQEKRSADFYMDSKMETSGDPQHPVETIQLGPQFLEQRLYQLSPPEVGFDPGEGGGEAVTAVPGRRDHERGRPDGGAVRRGEAGVRRRRGGRDVVGGVPTADGVVEPRHGGEELAGS
ncbi:unnamed protein product [Urochloa decumbens]|uniref:AB hydrolase-1 domain-containing protein n=1 Tax=Urochloa decumbens TaxID=240449 RepID=A0ABC8ZFU5_9POAL